MNEYKIFTDSASDLSKDLVSELNVGVVPLSLLIDDKTYRDGDISTSDFYNLLREGKMPSTSQASPNEFIKHFEPALKEGFDILYIAFSSALSGTYNSSLIAVKQLREQYPERKIVCIDTLAACLGQGLLVYYAVQKKNAGAAMDEVADYVESNKLNLCHWFTVNDLNHLKRGGRVSATAAVIGGILGIKPVMHVDDVGKLIPVYKVRGRRQSLDKILEQVENSGINLSEQTIFIGHGDCLEDAEYVAEQLKAKHSPKRIEIRHIGTVIGSHSGIGTLAVFFIGNKR